MVTIQHTLPAICLIRPQQAHRPPIATITVATGGTAMANTHGLNRCKILLMQRQRDILPYKEKTKPTEELGSKTKDISTSFMLYRKCLGQTAPRRFIEKTSVTGRPGGCAGSVAKEHHRSVYPTFPARRGNVSLVINCRPKVLRTQNRLRMAPTPAPTRVYCFIG